MTSEEKIAVLMTCYNRRETTLRCLESLYAQTLSDGTSFKVFLVDDGCTDGTGAAVKAAYPDVSVIQGTGDLFWCNGMRLAWEHAAKEDPDFYLWLNDDVQLCEGALQKLLATYADVRCQTSDVSNEKSGKNLTFDLSPSCSALQAGSRSLTSDEPTIIVGSCCDPETGEQTYGGQRRLGGHPGKILRIPPSDVPMECGTFEGNVVLVPRTVYQRVGMLDRFRHAMGDTDYGYRAKKAGCRIWIAPDFSGECHGNQLTSEALSQNKSVAERWIFRVSGKGLPPRDWFKFLVRHAGLQGIFYWGWSYLKVLLSK